MQPAFPLASGQVGGYVQQPERSSSGRPHAVHRPTVARWRKQASRFAAAAAIWVQATLIARWRDGHLFSPRSLGLLDVVLDVDVGAVPGIQPGELAGRALIAISW